MGIDEDLNGIRKAVEDFKAHVAPDCVVCGKSPEFRVSEVRRGCEGWYVPDGICTDTKGYSLDNKDWVKVWFTKVGASDDAKRTLGIVLVCPGCYESTGFLAMTQAIRRA